MENLSHSRHPNRSTAKMINNGGVLAKTLYDDVYGGPPKFGLSSLSPRLEDYSEIFGSFHASRASSIPVLEVPVVDDENEVFFDVRSSGFDYSEVFGGLDGLDFAVAYDDLVNQPKGGDGDSSDEAWTPAESGSLSEESIHSVKNQSFSDGDPYYSFDGSTEFGISYHKAHQESNKDSLNGRTHATTLPAAPGYRYMLDEITPLQQTEIDNPSLQVADDRKFNMYSNVEMVNENFKKTSSHPPNGSSAGQAYGDSHKPERGYGKNGSRHKEPFVTISDISLRTQPSHLPPPCRPPPIVDDNSGDSGRLSSNSNTVASDETTGDSSPPFFDVEVDASSSAAVSAAAMKEAMEKARVQLRSAKELMQKRKEGFHSRSKSRSKKERKEDDGKMGKVADGSSSKKDDRVQGTSEREDSRMKFAVSEERQNVLKKAREVPESLQDEKSCETAKNLVQEKHGKGSSQGSFKIDEASEWQEATQYFELVAIDDTKKAFEQANKDKILVQNTKRHEHRQKEKATLEVLEQQETDKKVRAVIEVHDPEDLEKKHCGLEECNARSKDAKEARRWKEHEKKVKVNQETFEKGENEMSSRMSELPAESEKQRGRSVKSEKQDNMVEVQGKENKFNVENAMQQKDNEAKLKENDKTIRSEERHKESRGEVFENRQDEALEQEENERRLKEAFKQAENEHRLKEVLEKEENEKRLKKALEQVENEKRLKKALELQENEKKLKEALEGEKKKRQKEATQREENEKQLKEALKMEEYQKRQKDACEREENERRLKMAEAREQQFAIKRLKESQEKVETERRLKEAFKQAEIQKKLDEASVSEETEKTFKVADDGEEVEVLNKTQKGTEMNENVQELRSVKGTHLHMEVEDHKVCDETWNQDYNENSQAAQIARNRDENSETKKEAQEVHAHEENGKKKTDNKKSDTRPGSEVVEPVNVSLDLEFKACGLSQEDLENGEKRFRRKDANESLPLDASMKKARDESRAEPKVTKRELGGFETINVPVDEKFKVSGLSGWAQGGLESGKSQFRTDDAYESLPFVNLVKKAVEEASSSIEKPQPKFNSTSQKDFDHEIPKMESAQEWKKREKDSKQVHASSNQKEYSAAEPVKEFVENKRKTEVAHPAMAEINNRKSSQQVNASQAPESKDKNLKEDLINGEKETGRLKRERELENDRLRKIEEEREREREREKDRMAVDRATLEARDWAYAEGRERAERVAMERATADARQRTMAEARERLEKACAEAREKSLAGKAAMEARLKAERAAVERATAEARERAAEKLMADRASFEARERVQRSVSDKFNASSRNNGLRQCLSSSDLQDPQFQKTGGSRHPYSTAYGERYEGVEGESAQRCKARLERHARTAERAARALAEKNMRDLLAQREQAERNRLAETLDADVKRWSSGKEGNLRALLSTLQYILGPDSGWQPIPLTEVITAAAVKRAYRKATLCVHPDKLQQRGASIHQKYICEKVFDLLKEAWNKFNSEER